MPAHEKQPNDPDEGCASPKHRIFAVPCALLTVANFRERR
jgi:hypothetical protein